MCGRYVNVAATDELLREFEADLATGDDLAPSWNVAPTDQVRIVVERLRSDDATGADRVRRELRTVRWGLVPSWSKDPRGGARMINARIETVTDKPAFRRAAAARRCLVPASGYYEWEQTPGGKTPWYLHQPDATMLAMAGLYEFWRDPDRADDDPDRWLVTCTVITQQATDALGVIHDRSPVVVPPELRDAWLDCHSDGAGTDARAAELLGQLPAPHLEPYVVGPAVGNVRNDGPELIAPVAP